MHTFHRNKKFLRTIFLAVPEFESPAIVASCSGTLSTCTMPAICRRYRTRFGFKMKALKINSLTRSKLTVSPLMGLRMFAEFSSECNCFKLLI